MSIAGPKSDPGDYLNQAAVPDNADYFRHWKDDSATARAKLAHQLDVPYGSDPREVCDIFPSARPGSPVFIFIHGGWWYFLDKSDFSYLATPFVERDATFVAVAYPLAPQAEIGGIVAAVKKAIIWIWKNIADFNGDPNQLHIGGHSAGGHLATMMCFNDWTKYGAPRKLLKSNCSISGLYDLEPLLASAQNDKIQMRPEVAIENSPIRHINNFGTKFLVGVGGAELPGFHRQHDIFLAAAKKADLPLVDVSIPGKHHFSIIDELGNPESVMFKAVSREMGLKGN